ncbi:MAG: hypothetical protein GX974_03790 [Clostridiales bacterium]|nr:hypothetical protein [Clostridiales bacterium]
MDHFHEESVSKVNTGLNTLVYILTSITMVVFAIIAVSFLMSIMTSENIILSIILIVVFGGLAYGSFVLRNNQRVEYDYTFTNGILDVAKITNNSKRKRVLSADIREFEIVASTKDPGFERMLNHKGIEKRHNVFLNRGYGLYYGIFDDNGVKSMIVFEPSETMLKLFKKFNPRNVKTDIS